MRVCGLVFFFFNDTATTEIYTLSLHDALPIWVDTACGGSSTTGVDPPCGGSSTTGVHPPCAALLNPRASVRSEEHTSELQSRQYLVCRLLLEKKKKLKLCINTHKSNMTHYNTQ